MNKKQISKIVSVIVTLIVISAIVAVGILLGKVSKEVSGLNNTETTESGGASVPESTVTQVPADTSAPVAPTVYGNTYVDTAGMAINDESYVCRGIAQYVTIGKYTYFYVKYDVSTLDIDVPYGGYYVECNLKDDSIYDFSYANIWRCSTDGLTWYLKNDFKVSGNPQYIYVCCCTVENCSNPDVVYNDLVEHFYSPYYDEGTETYIYSMRIVINHMDPDKIVG